MCCCRAEANSAGSALHIQLMKLQAEVMEDEADYSLQVGGRGAVLELLLQPGLALYAAAVAEHASKRLHLMGTASSHWG
jgi:hypothetical protein